MVIIPASELPRSLGVFPSGPVQIFFLAFSQVAQKGNAYLVRIRVKLL